MANLDLANSPQWPDLFRQTILANLGYWQAWVQENLADVATLEREQPSIVRAIGYALELEATWPAVIELVIDFSTFMERWGRWSIWRQVLERAIRAAQAKGDTARQTPLTALLARLMFRQNCFKESVHYYRQTIYLARQVGDSFNEGRACTNLGFYYADQGQWYRAEVLCCYALNLFEQLDNAHGCAHTENHLGFLYSRQHQWEQARQHLERACAIWETMGDEHGLMRGYLNLGGLYLDAEQPELALRYLNKGLYQAQKAGENIDLGIIYTNMGKAYRLREDWAEAEGYLRQAETIFQQYSDLAELARAWNELGLVYFYKDQSAEAMFYLEKSLELWRNLGVKFEEIEVLMDIGECELSRDNRRQALARLQAVEYLIGPNPEQGPYRHLQPRLTQYRRRLMQDKGPPT